MEPTNEQIESEFDKHAMAELKEKATQLYLTRFQSKRLDEWEEARHVPRSGLRDAARRWHRLKGRLNGRKASEFSVSAIPFSLR